MGEMVVKRWAKHGHERLYVSTADGVRVGWIDLKTGARVIEAPERAPEFVAAVAAHVHEMSLPSAQSPEADLLTHRPGQMARAKADDELTSQREQGRLRSALSRLADVHTDERAWRVGAKGEESVGARLEKLRPSGWTVIHSVPVGQRGSDIDHVLIGKGGVYTINTKNHPGGRVWVGRYAIKVNGHSVPYLRNSRFEAERSRKALTTAVGFEVPVRAVLVILTGTLVANVTIAQEPDDVLIMNRTDIPNRFKRAPERLSVEQVAQVVEVARKGSTWT